ncbi:MAG: M16 family metallopeptidase [Bacteroidales bacterium]
MKKHVILSLLMLLPVFSVIQAVAQTKGVQSDKTEILYKKFTLDNGLTLLVHEDHKAPIIAFNVWYHVGSKNEKAGRTGFAHLFEHLMFNGSENHNDDYFKPMQKIGTTDLNGTTNEDRTNYFENFPVSALDYVLWMESDRMGHLKGAIDQARLDEQRGVVQNEKRQGDNQPYSVTEELITKACFPAGHPYSWTVIGSMEDLSAASLDDVKGWFDSYYGPNNAVICLAGDITPEVALEKIKLYFGDIKPGPPVARFTNWIAKRQGIQRQSVQDRVPQTRLYMVWNVPQYGSKESVQLEMLTKVLSLGKTSRLYKRLVYDDQIASSVNAYIDQREIAGLFTIIADAKPGVTAAQLEKAINEELARLFKDGITEKEMKRVKTNTNADFIKGIERIGGFGGKSDILAKNEVYMGKADYYKTLLQFTEEANATDIQQAGKNWISDGAYVLTVEPFPQLSALDKGADRSKLPETGKMPDPRFPEIQKAKLSNGLEILLAEWHSVPAVEFILLTDAGYSSDQMTAPGTASLAMNMMDEGAGNRTGLEISETLIDLGADLGTGSNMDQSIVFLSALKQNLDASLEIFADVILRPTFPQTDFDRLQKLQLTRIQREKVSPFQIAWRSLPGIIFGKDHAYGTPWTGSGMEETVKKLTREDMVKFHSKWIKPNHSKLVIVGDITLKEIMPRLEKYFKDWKPGEIPKKNISIVERSKKQAVYIYDKPGSPQSEVFAASLATNPGDPDHLSIETMNFILGGDFVSRINMNIREDKNWSYGASSFLNGLTNQEPFIVYAPVQSDKTKETMMEIRKEIEGILGSKPATADELKNAISSQTLGIPGQYETMGSIQFALQQMVRYNYPVDYYQKYASKLKAENLKNINAAAKKILHPESFQWLIIGDKALIEPKIRELGITDIYTIDGDGKIVP